MEKIEFLREIDVKSRNLLHKFLGILLISAYGRKSNVLSLIRWKVPRFYRWSCMHNKLLMNDDSIAQKKILQSTVSVERIWPFLTNRFLIESKYIWLQSSNCVFWLPIALFCILKRASTINLYNTVCISLGQSSNVPFPSFPTNHLQLLDSIYMPNHFAAFSRMIRL